MYEMKDIENKIDKDGKITVTFNDDIDDITFTEKLSPEEALYQLNHNPDALLINTAEAASQAAKTHDEKIKDVFEQTYGPGTAKKFGKTCVNLRPDWGNS